MDTEIFVNSVNRKRESDGFAKYFFTNRRCAATLCRQLYEPVREATTYFPHFAGIKFLLPCEAQGYFGTVISKRQRRSQK